MSVHIDQNYSGGAVVTRLRAWLRIRRTALLWRYASPLLVRGPLLSPLTFSLPLPLSFPLASSLLLSSSVPLIPSSAFPLPILFLSTGGLLFLLNGLCFFLFAVALAVLFFVLLWIFELDCDDHAIYLSIVHAALRLLGIFLNFVVNNSIVLDLGVLPDADRVDVSEIWKYLADMSLG